MGKMPFGGSDRRESAAGKFFEGLKKLFYEAMKFDSLTGVVQQERILELGMSDILSSN